MKQILGSASQPNPKRARGANTARTTATIGEDEPIHIPARHENRVPVNNQKQRTPKSMKDKLENSVGAGAPPAPGIDPPLSSSTSYSWRHF